MHMYCRTIPKSIVIGMPLIILCYITINLSFFAVLTVSELSNSTAVALVSSLLFCVYILCVCIYVRTYLPYIKYGYIHIMCTICIEIPS